MDVSLSLNIINNLRIAATQSSSATEKLSSGLRINYGVDDPSGLGIGKRITAEMRGASVALENVQDGINLIKNIDAPLAEIQNMLGRIRDLALRASNDAILRYDCNDRTRMNNEARTLVRQINQTANSVKYNYGKILCGDTLKSIKQTPGTEQVVATAGFNPVNPGWGSNNTITFTADVTDTGAQTGARPSSAGGTTQRVFSCAINIATNAPGAQTQLTKDPAVLTDPDGDHYFDGVAGYNDPRNSAPGADPQAAMYPGHIPIQPTDDPDADADGWRATIDNNDNDKTETGNGLNALGPDRVLPVAATVTSKDPAIVTWQNTVTRTFTAGAIDQLDIQSANANKYQVQVFDVGTASWTTVAAGLIGNQTVNLGADTAANAARVVYDDPVSNLNGTTDITGIRNATVNVNATGAASPPDTFKYDFGGLPKPVNTVDVNVTNGVTYSLYSKNGGAPVLVGNGAGGAAPTTFNPAGSSTDFFVELNSPGAVTSFAAYNAEALNSAGAAPAPKTYEYNLGGPQTYNDLQINVTPGVAFNVYQDNGANPLLVGGGVGAAAPTSFNVVNASNVWVELAAPGAVTAFTPSNTVALGGPAPAGQNTSGPGEDFYQISVNGGAGANLQDLTLTTTSGGAFNLYYAAPNVDPNPPSAPDNSGTSGVQLAVGANPTQIWVGVPIGDTVIGQTAVEVPGAAAGPANADHVFRYNMASPGNTVTNLNLEVTNGMAFTITDDTGAAVGAGVGAGAGTLVNVPVGNSTSAFFDINVGLNIGTAADVISVAGRNVPAATNGPNPAPHNFQYDLATPGQTITSVDLEVTNLKPFQLYDDTGTLLGAGVGAGAGSPVTINGFGSINPNSLQVRFALDGGAQADVISVKPSATYAPVAAPDSFVDIANDDTNVAVYQINSAAGWGDGEFDRINIGVKNNHPFTMSWSDDNIAWTDVTGMTAVNGTGAPVQYNFTSDQVIDTNRDGTAYMRVQILSGEKTTTAITSAPVITNRIDRDGDGWPDVIEVKGGSNPDQAASVPYNATGGPDNDNDGFADVSALYDPIVNGVRETDFPASANPYNLQWTDGTGNPLNSTGPGAQYPNPGDMVDASRIPSTADADGDTTPDPYDPFPNVPEFMTWKDGEASQNGGSMVFVSDRATPNDPAQSSLYMLVGGVYSQVPNTVGATDPVFSPDGSSYAYEMGGGIMANLGVTGCLGAANATIQVTPNGTNPTWNSDNSAVTFERAGKIIIKNLVDGIEYDYGISGSNPSFSATGDEIAYSRGGNLYAYSLVTESEFDMQIQGDNPSFSPAGDKIAYTRNGVILVSSLTIDKQPPVLQVGGNSGSNSQISVSYPDARSGALGINHLTVISQADALDAIDLANNAIDIVSQYRTDAGDVEKRLIHIANELSVYRINSDSSRSRIEDSDMALETTDLLRSQLMSNASQSAAIHASSVLQNVSLDAIRLTLGMRI